MRVRRRVQGKGRKVNTVLRGLAPCTGFPLNCRTPPAPLLGAKKKENGQPKGGRWEDGTPPPHRSYSELNGHTQHRATGHGGFLMLPTTGVRCDSIVLCLPGEAASRLGASVCPLQLYRFSLGVPCHSVPLWYGNGCARAARQSEEAGELSCSGPEQRYDLAANDRR